MVLFDEAAVSAAPVDIADPVLLPFLCGFFLALRCAPEPVAVDPALPLDVLLIELSPIVSDPMLPVPEVVPPVVGGVVEPGMPLVLPVEPIVDPGMLPVFVD